ncbi:hypothetical protein D6792_00925 [Candidatus Parcubacteria bacterium]|nr:MAG: hypothetical protein D6792_00925 [Candidatus Parcubacteria bacterium]GIW68616.1 MAG: hypothetical protein KatS3mg100_110 [Candidatus Parcubacteria bacterium]
MARPHKPHAARRRAVRAATLSALTVAVAGGLLWAATVFSGVTYRAAPPSAAQTAVATEAAASTQTARADGEQEAAQSADSQEKAAAPPALYLPTPEPVRAVYMSQCVVGTPSLREKLVRLIEETELNAVVIDVKDYTGTIGFPTSHPLLRDAAMQHCGARDMREFVRRLNEKGIYTIARITVFQDPWYALRHPDEAIQHKSLPGEVWRDKKGLSFVDVSARPFWDYILALAREARAVGFDELNFDYIRFPSDGDMESVAFPWTKDTPKPEALERFFAFLHQELRERDHIPISADLFGMTTTVHHDLNIGQVLERAAPYFDFIAPMVYPSHYPPGYLGLANSNSDPYRVVFNDLSEAARRLEATTTPIRTLRNESPKMRLEVIPASSSTPTTTREVFTGLYQKSAYPRTLLRPWLQDFDYGGNYGPKEVRAQIQAVYDVGLTSWMLWSPSNRYTSEALEHSGAQAPGG